VVAIGELGLDGSLRPVRGALSVARRLAASGQRKRDAWSNVTLILPPPNVPEASLVSTLVLSAPPTLTAIVAQLEAGKLDPPGAGLNDTAAAPATESVDLGDVVGQKVAKRALEIAAAGAHALLMVWSSRPKRVEAAGVARWCVGSNTITLNTSRPPNVIVGRSPPVWLRAVDPQSRPRSGRLVASDGGTPPVWGERAPNALRSMPSEIFVADFGSFFCARGYSVIFSAFQRPQQDAF
jgi:hypothetical protein